MSLLIDNNYHNSPQQSNIIPTIYGGLLNWDTQDSTLKWYILNDLGVLPMTWETKNCGHSILYTRWFIEFPLLDDYNPHYSG